MATNLFEQYGIKEVADLTFYNINTDGTKGAPVLFIDTAKVSTIEQTGEQTEARGGKGNPPLIIWDYGKEITLTLEDALYSPASMAIMFGANENDERVSVTQLTRMKKVVYNGSNITGSFKAYVAPTDFSYMKEGLSGAITTTTGLTQNTTYYVEEVIDTAGHQMIINADTFPGTYWIVGETYSRSAIDGKDRYFQFEIPKAKMNSEQTLTLEAEGDPTVFNMTLRVLRGPSGEMIKLTQYDNYGPEGEITKN